MRKFLTNIYAEKHYFIVGIIAVYLILKNLGQIPFWDDEASVAWFSKNIDSRLQLFAFDGTNAFFYRNGDLINEEFIYNNPPLDIYFARMSSFFFGESNFGFRFGFALLGILSIFLYYKILKTSIQNSLWRFLSFSSFVLSINFLLFSRNCRYFSIELFCGLLLYFLNILYFRAENNFRRYSISFGILVVSFSMFLGHFSQGFIFTISLFFSFLYTKKIKPSTLTKDHISYLMSILGSIFLSTMYIILCKNWIRKDMSDTDFYLLKISKLSIWLVHDLNRYFLFPIIFVIPLIVLFANKKYRLKFLNSTFLNFSLFVFIFLFFSIVLSPQPTSKTGSFEMRYIYSIFPFISILTSYFLFLISTKINRFIFVNLFLLFSLTSMFFYIPTSTPFRFTLLDLVHQTHFEYKTASSELNKYLSETLNSKKKIRIFPEYYHTTLNYYFPDKIVSVSQLDSTSGKKFDKLIKKYKLSHAIAGNESPEMVILIGDCREEAKKVGIHLELYHNIDTLKVYGGDGFDISRPEMAWHSFYTIKDFNISKDAVYIYKK